MPGGATKLTLQAALATLCGHELYAENDDTCDGHGSHCGSLRHGNGGREKSYGAVGIRRLLALER